MEEAEEEAEEEDDSSCLDTLLAAARPEWLHCCWVDTHHIFLINFCFFLPARPPPPLSLERDGVFHFARRPALSVPVDDGG